MITSFRQRFVFFYFLTISLIMIIVYSFFNTNLNSLPVIQNSQQTKYILYWTPMFDSREFYLGLGSKLFSKCTYSNCFATNNKTLVPIEEFSAILFHGVEYNNRSFGQPEKRNPNQMYVYSNQESPLNSPGRIKATNGFYNWTMTHRLDSDLVRSYGYVVEQDNSIYQFPSYESIKKKELRIAWFVSNCGTASLREDLAAKIHKYIPVDIYGNCGSFSCPKNKQEDCYDMLEQKYLFYFSAENSICVDYVTEKLYNILKKNVVPIVYGGGNYDKVAPPHSVIDVTEFESVLDIAYYLTFLHENPEEYLNYFNWKKHYIIDTSSDIMLCKLCEKLNKPVEHKIYEDIYTWWFGENSSACKSGKSLPKIVSSEI